jgi:hypothetical protein
VSSRRIACHAQIEQPKLDLYKVISIFSSPDLLDQPRDCYQIIREYEASQGDAMPMNL